ncbi:MAG: hypothetical protein SFU83_23525 [Meiothermus sp.]|nr:hypothetical protein [Meiothermus sp.]
MISLTKEPGPIAIALDDEAGVTCGELLVRPCQGRVRVALVVLGEQSDEWLLEPGQAANAPALLEAAADHGAPVWYDLALEPAQARELARAIRHTAALVRRGWA